MQFWRGALPSHSLPTLMFFHLGDTLPPLRLLSLPALTVTHPIPPTVTSAPTLTGSTKLIVGTLLLMATG